MADSETLIAALSKLTHLLPTPEDIQRVLEQLLATATDMLELEGSTLMLVSEGRGFATAAPDELMEVELCQQRWARGPGMEAFRTGAPVAVADIAEHGRRWPEYAVEAKRHGVSAVAQIPMRRDGVRVGALGLYSPAPRDWTDRDLAVGEMLAGMGTGHVLTANTLRKQQHLTEQLQHALSSRIVIEQAKGMVANARATSPAAAFDLIRGHARRNQIPVRDVARGIVELGLRI